MNKHYRQQRTIARATGIQGYGYWLGSDVNVEFRPAEPDSGYVFVRRDLNPVRRIEALPRNRVNTPRRTTLTENGGTVEMVEHLLAALAGMQIDNCEIVVNGAEMPAGDGSSQSAVTALQAAGIIVQDAVRSTIAVSETFRVGNDDCWIEARPAKTPGLSIRYVLDYGTGPIGQQAFELTIDPDSFCRELAPARTFLTQSEAEVMKARGLGHRTTYRDLLVFGPDGVIENTLRYKNECVRHKILDMVGDLALMGHDLQAHIVAQRSGHRHNATLAAALLDRYAAFRHLRSSA